MSTAYKPQLHRTLQSAGQIRRQTSPKAAPAPAAERHREGGLALYTGICVIGFGQ